ncbi:ATP synthase epsilon chain [Philodulcilactobacillus myokoensis]|uniref:ATP synthase epsilon chain n=1 Tax=Philodulcilactobacillus myokoensis TaxID=2929573 RepID=A0A9W6ESR9_9LACO|nr:F0F1 ATP synthase subunit epsilon [Philodulcilactobacillus myokoensis]GLB47075.1 ATP synthase epsilon chain [Philodulcilactobacillus myokoensis]
MADSNSVLTVSIVTPDGKVYEQKAASLVIVTTKSGQLGIMPNHVPVIASLEVDEVRVNHDNATDEVAVNGGFIEFSDNAVTIVADSAENKNDIDVDRAKRAQQRAQNVIQKAKNAHDDKAIQRSEVALRRALNRIKVASH